MKDAPLVFLRDVAEFVQYGYTASASDAEVGPKFLRITDIVGPRIDWDSVPYCRVDDANLARFSLAPGDVVIARTGATVGYAKLIRHAKLSVFASYLVRIRVDPTVAEAGYIGRLVESDTYKRFVLSHVGGAAQPNASAKVLTSFRFRLPDISIQKRIASVLGAYDDLIENNQRRIRLLEQSARLLYKEWFVHLRFPGHVGVAVVGGVPEGWERKKIGEVCPFRYGKALKKSDRIPGPHPVFGSSGVVGTHEKALVGGPAIIVGRKGNVGSVFWSEGDCHPIDTVYYVDSGHSTAYVYHALLDIQLLNTDAAVPGLNRDLAHKPRNARSRCRTYSYFEKHTRVIRGQIHQLTNQNDTLNRARDLLLPRLMNGEIAV